MAHKVLLTRPHQPTLSLAHSTLHTGGSLLFLRYIKHPPAIYPLPCLFPLPVMLVPTDLRCSFPHFCLKALPQNGLPRTTHCPVTLTLSSHSHSFVFLHGPHYCLTAIYTFYQFVCHHHENICSTRVGTRPVSFIHCVCLAHSRCSIDVC